MIEWVKFPQLVEYKNFLDVMENKVNEVINAKSPETIYLLEHDNVYSAGISANLSEVISNVDNISIINVARGGKITYHGPGQRIIYPILNLGNNHRIKDIKLYIANLEKWIISTLKKIGIIAYTVPGTIGVWTYFNDKHAKIAFIGVKVRKWVTYHGVSVNISTDITKFNNIIPCGIEKLCVTSLEMLGIKISLEDFDCILKDEFCRFF